MTKMTATVQVEFELLEGQEFEYGPPPGDFLNIAMKPMAKYNGALIDFTVAKAIRNQADSKPFTG